MFFMTYSQMLYTITSAIHLLLSRNEPFYIQLLVKGRRTRPHLLMEGKNLWTYCKLPHCIGPFLFSLFCSWYGVKLWAFQCALQNVSCGSTWYISLSFSLGSYSTSLMNPNIPTCLQAPDCEHGHSEVLSGDAVHLKAKQESAATQLQSMVTQLKYESFGPQKLGEQGKDFNKSLQVISGGSV